MNAERFATAAFDLLTKILNGPKIAGRFDALERENAELKAEVAELKARLLDVEATIAAMRPVAR